MKILGDTESRSAMMRPAFDRVRWDDVDTIDEVTSTLIGDVSYWDDKKIHEKYWSDNPVDIEIGILRSIHQHDWYKAQPYGKPMWEHFAALSKVLTPNLTDIVPEYYDLIQAFFIINGTNGKALSLVGAQSLCKTGGITRLYNTGMTVYGKESMLFIGTPANNVSDTGAYGELVGLAEETNRNHKHLFPDFRVPMGKDDRYVVYHRNGKFGSIEVRKPSDAWRYKGTKQSRTGNGWFSIFHEEVNEHQRSAYFDFEKNLTSNRNYISLSAFNWEGEDLGQEITLPHETRSKFDEHKDIGMDTDFSWDTRGEGIALRLDGLRSLNILTGKDLTGYNYFKQDNLDFLASRFGEDSAEYLSQARAYPGVTVQVNTVFSKSNLGDSMYKDDYVGYREIGRTSFLDAAFGGKDSSYWSYAVTYDIHYVDGSGKKRTERALCWIDKPRKITISEGQKWNEYWFRKAGEAGLNTSDYKEGMPLLASAQLAIKTALLNKANKVPFNNYGYDPSLNAELSTEHTTLYGGNVATYINYNGKFNSPTDEHAGDCYLSQYQRKAKGFAYNRRSQIFFFAASLLGDQLIRGGRFIEEPLNDFCKHRILNKGDKRQVEPNADYKSRNRGDSPDEMTAVIGNMEMARIKTGLGIKTLSSRVGKLKKGLGIKAKKKKARNYKYRP